jgi:hypothetical protein
VNPGDKLINQPQLWVTHTESETQEIAPVPPAEGGTPPDEWLGGVHPDGQLEVTSGFHLHADKFSRVMSYLARERQSRGSVYEQLMKATGMSHTQVQALMQYGANMELLVPRSLRVTPLGRLVLRHDPFFDRPGTLWLLHYLFASNPLLVVWNYMCNGVLPAVAEISKAEAADQFLPFVGRWSESSIRKNVRKELHAFFADYVAEMFAPLNYLREVRHNVYAVSRDVAPVPPLILLVTVLIYRDRHQPGSSGVEIPTLVYAEHSPGRIMRQSEMYLRRALNELHEAGRLTIESKANLDQVRFRSGSTELTTSGSAWLEAVRTYYQERRGD